MAVARTDPKVSSVFLSGPIAEETTTDIWGRSIGEIVDAKVATYRATLESLFHQGLKKAVEFGKKVGKGIKGFTDRIKKTLGGFVSKIGDSLNKLKEFAGNAIEAGKNIYGAIKKGSEMWNAIHDGNYEGFLEMGRGVFGNSLVDLGKAGLEVRQFIKNKDYKNFADLQGLVSKITGIDLKGIDTFLDIQAKVSTIVKLAQQYNVKGIIRKVRDLFRRHPVGIETLLQGVRQNLLLGQVDIVDEILMILDGKLVGKIYPEFVQIILQNYRFPTGEYEESKHDAWRNQLISIFNRIDKDWAYETINGVKYKKLAPWIGISPHAMILFQFHDEFGVPAHIASRYPTEDTASVLNRQYPYLKI